MVAIILIIASIAIPNLLRSKMSANEAAAVSVVRNVHNSQAVYVVQYTSSVGYATYTWSSWVQAPPATTAHACLTDMLVGCVAEPCVKSGYMFYLTSTLGAEPYGDYTVTRHANFWANTGQKNYCSTEDGVIHKSKNGSASYRRSCHSRDLHRSLRNTALGG